MRMHGNTIFITGATSGIGRGLAEAFHQRGNQVIISGRREDRLKDVCQHHPGMAYCVLDVMSPESIQAASRKLMEEFPKLNCLINNAGVQMQLNVTGDGGLDEERLLAEINTNLLGPIRVTAALLPHLAKQKGSTLINVSSGLAFVPMARFPVYCASKAAIHSWTMSLRQQLRSSGLVVIEIIPPWVATDLGGPRKPGVLADGRSPMLLGAFIAEAMGELESGAEEAAIGDAKRLVAATSPETVKKIFEFING